MAGPFKMKGSPMARNFGAPFKKDYNPNESVSTKRQGTENEDKHWSPRAYSGNTDSRGNKTVSRSKMSNEFASKTDSLPHNYTSHSYTVDKGNRHDANSYARTKKYENKMIAVKPKAKAKPKAKKKKTTIKYGGTAGKI